MLPGQGQGSAGASYTDTENAKHGDLGSKLPPLDTGVVWKAGAGVEVAWNLKAWHGGGYTCLLRARYIHFIDRYVVPVRTSGFKLDGRPF